MKVLARPAGTGKTKELLELAAKNNGQVLTTNKAALRVKANAYGLDVPIIDIEDFYHNNYDPNKQFYIHKVEDIAFEILNLPFSYIGGFSVRMES